MADHQDDIDLPLDTQGDVALHDGTSHDDMIADQPGTDLAVPDQVAVTQRSRRAVQNYRNDVREARVVAAAPPSMGQLIDQLWHRPEVVADSGLLRVAVRVYALLAIPVVALMYCLIAVQSKPALAVVVDPILIFLIWMWFFS